MPVTDLASLKAEDVVFLEWRDAFFDYELRSLEDSREDYIVKTVGFYLGHDENFFHFTMEMLPGDDGFRGITHIPISMIVTVNGGVIR